MTEKQQHDEFWKNINAQCTKCANKCKQSAKVELITCTKYSPIVVK